MSARDAEEELEENPSAVAVSGLPSRWLAVPLLLGAAIVPVAVSYQGSATFRLPNQLVMQATAIVAATMTIIAALLRSGRQEQVRVLFHRRALLLGAAGIGWTLVATIFSRHRPVSIDSYPFVFSAIAVAVLAAGLLRHVSPHLVAATIFPAAAVNVAVVMLQASHIWNPWVFEKPYSRLHKNAMLGNPNDVGALLVGPAIFAAAMAVAHRKYRVPYALAAILFASGIVVTETLTAFASTLAGIAALVVVRYGRRGTLVALLVLVVASAGAMLYPPLMKRVVSLSSKTSSSTIDVLISGRVPSMVAAWEMFTDAPLTGVGPGIYKVEYVRYRVAVIEPYGVWFRQSTAEPTEHFNEVHNDHLQLLAESGIPGYAIMLLALTLIASITFRTRREDGSHATVARLLALPLCVGLAVTMVTGFPLQLAAPVMTFAVLGGACLAWQSENDAAA